MPTPSASAPIGVFDSGVGGLSVLHQIHALLPHESLIYVADSGHAPYGDKSADFIEARAVRLIEHLQAQGAKAIVVACNTVTGLCIGALRQRFADLPIVAIEPAVKPAVLATRSGVVGVLATRQTVASPGLARLVQTHGPGKTLLLQACPGWVERVERGELDGPATEAAVAAVVRPLLDQGADTLVLGCTHYPFLAPVIRRLAGPDVQIIDPSAAVARELGRRLQHEGLAAPGAGLEPEVRFWTSGPIHETAPIISRLWGETVTPLPLPL
ncbi:MAG: glutamate racemase [Burkholderiaceae bacterium]|nr:glutamate racemase [Burkholderiaceae bacterium]